METLMKVQAIDANLIQSDPVGFGSLLNGGIALRAALIALVFGSILTVLNQSGALFGQLEIQLLPLVLVYVTPFITVTISQVLGIREAILDVMQKRVQFPIEEHFLSTVASHGIPSRAIWIGLMIGSVNLSIIFTTLFLQNEEWSSVPVALLGQAYSLPVLFGVLSQAISYRRAAGAFIQRRISEDKKQTGTHKNSSTN